MVNKEIIEKYFSLLMSEGMGLDLSDPNLIGTPKRVANMYSELFSGIGKEKELDEMTSFPNESKYDEIVMMDNINFVSVCSHHFLPFTGKAWVAYIPNEKVLGASKASRIIDHFAKKPQLQENLCDEVSNYLQTTLKPKGVAVVMRAVHGCMKCRGIKQYDNAGMITSSLKGTFKESASTKLEMLNLIELSSKRV